MNSMGAVLGDKAQSHHTQNDSALHPACSFLPVASVGNSSSLVQKAIWLACPIFVRYIWTCLNAHLGSC